MTHFYRKPQRKPMGVSLIERAIIDKEWRSTVTSGQITALMGDGSNEMVNGAGRVLFVVLGACIAEEVDTDLLELRIIRGACNAVYEQKDEPTITAARRASIVSGLDACNRLIEVLPRRALVDAACDLAVKMRTQHINWTDFVPLLEAVAA